MSHLPPPLLRWRPGAALSGAVLPVTLFHIVIAAPWGATSGGAAGAARSHRPISHHHYSFHGHQGHLLALFSWLPVVHSWTLLVCCGAVVAPPDRPQLINS